MKILEFKNITRKDVPIYYRSIFSGTAALELINKSVDVSLDFSIEKKPTGYNEIIVTLNEKVDYPLVPLIKELKKYIDNLDASGALPG
ncbi:MAG: hypothetical protein LBL64_05650 [Treponema sp.]|jgi:hypothetical protein|nr:hypothetical protein [Treponema sp.]